MIASFAEKSVSSRAGHALMEGNAFAKPRYEQANERLLRLLPALKSGDLETFGQICENEALTLHALMMASNPSYILMRPNTLKMIELLRAYRLIRNIRFILVWMPGLICMFCTPKILFMKFARLLMNIDSTL